MKRLILAAALIALPAAAFAQSQVAVDEIRISGAASRIELPDQLRNVWADEFDQVKGTYRLSNGKTMQLGMWGNRMYAKVDGMPRTQLVAATPYMFVGLDRSMRIRITDIDSAGPINAEVLLSTPALAGNTTDMTLTRLVASR
jgi:hypothetical protein